MQHYSGIRSLQQVYQNSQFNNQPQNYMINCQPNNDCAMPNGQMIQHMVTNNVDNNGQKWHGFINHSQRPQQPVFNNFNQAPYHLQQAYTNQRPSNMLQSSNTYPPSDNYLSQDYLLHDQIMQSNKEPQSEQFFLHNIQPQKYRKNWDLSPTPQTQTFAQESQNVWNGR